ncbi:SDR family oxidoreductase [bacterium]|nr:SDR family oxidoreductase [bacterium]
MDLGLKDRVALVTASSKGLGRAVAWSLAREGTKLVICSRNKDILEKTADDIFLGTGVSVFPLAVDLSEADQVEWLMDETLDLFGRVDILVTNAGGPKPGNFTDLEEADWMHAIQLNLMSVVRLCRAVIPSMKKNNWGRIINLASVSVKQPIDNLFLSNTIRPGVIGLTKSLSQELARYNILVNAVCPGYILTDRVEQLLEAKSKQTGQSTEELKTARIADIPLGRIGDPGELANMVAFLASDRASYITGTTIPVDGGMIKGLM